MRDGCGRGHNEFAGRVQNHHVCFSFHRNGHILEILYSIKAAACRSGYSMPLWALAIALSTGKNTRLFGMLDQNETRFFTYLPVTACREQGSHCRDERLAGVAPRWQGAPAHSSRKSWERTARELTTLILWLINSSCELTGSNL